MAEVELKQESQDSQYPGLANNNEDLDLSTLADDNTDKEDNKEDGNELSIEDVKSGINKYGKEKNNERAFLNQRFLLNNLSNTVKTYTIGADPVEWINEPIGFILDGKTYERSLDPKDNQKPEYIAAAIGRTPRTDIIYNGTGFTIVKEIVEVKDNNKSILPSRMNIDKDNYQKKVFIMIDSDGDGTLDRSGIYLLSNFITKLKADEEGKFEGLYIEDGFKRDDENNELNYLTSTISNKFKNFTQEDFKTATDFENYNKNDPEQYDENGSVKFNKEYFYNVLSTKNAKKEGEAYVNWELTPEEQEQAKQYYQNTLNEANIDFKTKEQTENKIQ